MSILVDIVLYCYKCVRSQLVNVTLSSEDQRLIIGCMRCRRQLAPLSLSTSPMEVREGPLEVYIERA